MKCDGIRPECTVCIERGCPCEYNDDDKRKTNFEQMEDLKGRIGKLESMIETFIRGATQASDDTRPAAPSMNGLSNSLISPPEAAGRDIRPLPERPGAIISPTTTFGRESLAQVISPGQGNTPSRFGEVDYERLQVGTNPVLSDKSG